jgi:hypothetical protein
VRTTGNNLQILIERTDNTTHAGFLWATANGNNTSNTLTTCRRYNNTTALSAATSLSVSAFRAQIRLIHGLLNDASVTQVYTLGKLPLFNSAPHTVSAKITNVGLSSLVSVPVTLTISGANSFTDTQIIPTLAAGASTTINFTAYTPLSIGITSIGVSVPADDDNSNNVKTATQIVNNHTWSYAQGVVATGTAGFGGNTIDLVQKFYNTSATSLSQVNVYFSAAAQPYKIGIWDATGVGGTPGLLLYETGLLNSSIGINEVPIAPVLSLPVGSFFVGARQVTTTNFSLSRQTETPARLNTFYYALPSGSTTWVDNALGSTNVFMIEPKLQLPVDAKISNIIIPSGNTCISSSETVTAVLTNVGSSVISNGAAAVTLKIGGANPQTITLSNTTNIASGSTELISFSSVNFSNAGLNYDTVFVNLVSDVEKANDTAILTNNRIARNIALETTVGVYPLTSNCEDLGWTYYTDAFGKNVLAVEWGANTASKTAAIASITLDATDFSSTAGAGAAATGTFTMKRYWNIDVGASQPTTPVNVRFFYDAAEKMATENDASNYQLANVGSTLKSPKWFKTALGAFAGDALHVNNNAVVNAIALTDVNIGAATINGVLYAQFNGITSFSGGGYATGVGSSSVLPVGIQYIKGTKIGVNHLLDWKVTCTAGAALKISLERSADGLNFDVIHEQVADEIRCLQAFNYVDAKLLSGANYYRVKVTSADGSYRYSSVVVLFNKEKDFEIASVLPNPVKDNLVLNITSDKMAKINIVVTDLAGKLIASNASILKAGDNAINVNFANYSVGSYIITLTNTMGEIISTRIVKY